MNVFVSYQDSDELNLSASPGSRHSPEGVGDIGANLSPHLASPELRRRNHIRDQIRFTSVINTTTEDDSRAVSPPSDTHSDGSNFHGLQEAAVQGQVLQFVGPLTFEETVVHETAEQLFSLNFEQVD